MIIYHVQIIAFVSASPRFLSDSIADGYTASRQDKHTKYDCITRKTTA
jgi:hypothetical protein